MEREVAIEFHANVVIPPGYILLNYDDFKDSIALDESELATNIIMGRCNCEEAGNYMDTKNLALLTGILNYNVTFENLIPAQPINSILSSMTTQFSSNGFLQVNKILTSSLNNDFVSTDYWIDCTKGEEFITCNNGVSLYRIRDCCSFMRMLNNPNQEKVVRVPYRIKIHSGIKRG
ncbi:MAG: hypothetical protein ACERKN_07485 [Velocimicrobium sp.]